MDEHRGEQTDLTLTTSRNDLKRRGLFAMGAALLGAAVAKLSSPGQVDAAPGGNFILGQANDSGTVSTKLTANVASDNTLNLETNRNDGNALVGSNTGNGGGLVGSVTGTGTALAGISQKGIGLSGTSFATTGTDFAGVSGFSSIGFGTRGGTASPATTTPQVSGILGEGGASANGVQGTSIAGVAVLGVTSGGLAGRFDGAVTVNGALLVNGSFTATGIKSAAVPNAEGTLVRLYCQESPESYFEDFGEASIQSGGYVDVALRSDFAQLVNTQGYQVFLTAYSDMGALRVSARGPSGFQVASSTGAGGTFGYRVVAKRKDVTAKRLDTVVIPRGSSTSVYQPREVPVPDRHVPGTH